MRRSVVQAQVELTYGLVGPGRTRLALVEHEACSRPCGRKPIGNRPVPPEPFCGFFAGMNRDTARHENS
jgi:hypothetical protein